MCRRSLTSPGKQDIGGHRVQVRDDYRLRDDYRRACLKAINGFVARL
jgi:hypothetical protein